MRELTDDGGTGDAQVDEAVRTLESLDGLPAHEHAAVFERVHQVLQDRLSGEPDAADDTDATSDIDATGDGYADGGAGRPGPDGREG
jgi:hypothetical protein